jgi:hypothetical protein
MNLGLGNAQKFYLGDQDVSKIFLQDKEAYTSTWDIGIQTTDVNQTFSVNIASGTSPNITVDWGDGTIETFTTTGVKTRTYASAGNYTVKIRGSFASNGNIRLGNTSAERARVRSTSAIPLIPGLSNFVSTFIGCNSLSSIPSDLFAYNPNVTSFLQTFLNCFSLASIPESLFANNINVNSFTSTFNTCTSLTFIPPDLFANNINTTTFNQTFFDCISLSSIPSGLFRNNILVTQFTNTFDGCALLTSVPESLFANNINVNSFNLVFALVTLTTESYSNLLVNIASNAASRLNNVLFHGGNSKYNLTGQAAKQILEAKGWIFTDGGLE